VSVPAPGEDVGIEYATVLGFPPVDFVHLAADLGCHAISMKARGGAGDPNMAYNPWRHPAFSFIDDAGLRRRMAAALQQRGVSISLAEGSVVRPGTDLLASPAYLDTMAELGVTRLNAVSLDPDLDRTLDQYAALADEAARRGMETVTEFAPGMTVCDLETGLRAVRHVGRPDFRLLVDTMHVVRSGATAGDLAAVDPDLIGYVQLCDSTRRQRGASYWDDTSDRDIPGQGELPLVDLLLALPPGLPVGLEVPMRSRADQGASPQECARLAVAGGRAVLAAVKAGRDGRAGSGDGPASQPGVPAGG
jgi:sugar phosphate isomerase/epimerase